MARIVISKESDPETLEIVVIVTTKRTWKLNHAHPMMMLMKLVLILLNQPEKSQSQSDEEIETSSDEDNIPLNVLTHSKYAYTEFE